MSKAIIKVDGSRILVNANTLNRVYSDLVMLAHETGHIVELCNHTTLKGLQTEIKKISFGYARCYGELNRLILEGEK